MANSSLQALRLEASSETSLDTLSHNTSHVPTDEELTQAIPPLAQDVKQELDKMQATIENLQNDLRESKQAFRNALSDLNAYAQTIHDSVLISGVIGVVAFGIAFFRK